jgi:hypothetical protein
MHVRPNTVHFIRIKCIQMPKLFRLLPTVSWYWRNCSYENGHWNMYMWCKLIAFAARRTGTPPTYLQSTALYTTHYCALRLQTVTFRPQKSETLDLHLWNFEILIMSSSSFNLPSFIKIGPPLKVARYINLKQTHIMWMLFAFFLTLRHSYLSTDFHTPWFTQRRLVLGSALWEHNT